MLATSFITLALAASAMALSNCPAAKLSKNEELDTTRSFTQDGNTFTSSDKTKYAAGSEEPSIVGLFTVGESLKISPVMGVDNSPKIAVLYKKRGTKKPQVTYITVPTKGKSCKVENSEDWALVDGLKYVINKRA
ncbi:hypothetical protein CBS101457_005472 [Exobasidium rhododendri]|nr:hypothetical protein CBS101457_005472 [Exobasidium rhododendri]